jgi:hypothetical protein
MPYWTRIRRRAWREQLDEFKSNSARAAAQILTPTLTALALALIFSNQWSVSGLIALAVLITSGGGRLAARVLALPGVIEGEHARLAHLAERQLKEEIELLETVMKTFTPLTGDETLRAGLAYCEHRDWASAVPIKPDRLGELLHQVRHLGQLERLHLWGRPAPTGHLLPIPPAYWESGRIDPASAVAAGGKPIHTRRDDAQQPHRFYDLRINRAEFEREWPAN